MRFILVFPDEVAEHYGKSRAAGLDSCRYQGAMTRLRPMSGTRTGEGSGLEILRDSIKFAMLRDLRSLDAQIAAYPDDDSLWQVVPGISNSAGNLSLHLAGNLRHFVGSTLCGTGYVRDRASEFASRGLTRDQLRHEVRLATEDVGRSLDMIDPRTLADVYPSPIVERRVRTAEFLVHLAAHLTYHLGQIDYHRRILTIDPKPVENLSVLALPLAH